VFVIYFDKEMFNS